MCSDAQSAVNLVTNGSFDGPYSTSGDGTNTPSGWTRRAGLTYVVNDPGGNAVDGPNYLQAGGFTEMGQNTGYVLQGGETFEASMYARDFGSNHAYDVRFYANPNPGGGDISGGDILYALQGTPNSSTMGLYSAQFTVPAGEAGRTLFAYLDSGDGYVGFDKVSLTAVPEPASLSALVLAGVGLQLRRRRSAGNFRTNAA
jgi:hypothetical protein